MVIVGSLSSEDTEDLFEENYKELLILLTEYMEHLIQRSKGIQFHQAHQAIEKEKEAFSFDRSKRTEVLSVLELIQQISKVIPTSDKEFKMDILCNVRVKFMLFSEFNCSNTISKKLPDHSM
jgi:hypothetical protein